jgi:putative resolvase
LRQGLDGTCPKLRRLLSDPDVTLLVMEHCDQLAQFGVEHLEAALSAHGRRVLVLDTSEVIEVVPG